MNIFLKTFSVKKYFIRLEKYLPHLRLVSRVWRVSAWLCVRAVSASLFTRHRDSDTGTSVSSNLGSQHTAAHSHSRQQWGCEGEGSPNKSTTKAQNNFKVHIKVFHGWCFVSNAILFWINEIDNNFVTRYDFKHFDAVYASKVPFLKIVQKCITQKI